MSRRLLATLATAGALLVLSGAAVLLFGGDDTPAATEQSVAIQVFPESERDPLPAFSGEAVRAGQANVDLARFAGNPLVVNVWASWCGPCRAEQRGLEQASQLLAADQVGFVGVNVRDDRAAATAYLEEFGVSYPSVYDRESRFVQELGDHAPLAPPYTLVVDADGRIAARILGVLPGGGDPQAQAAELAATIEQALGQET